MVGLLISSNELPGTVARHMALCSGLVGTIEWPIMYQKPEDSKEQAVNEMIVTPDCEIADYWATTLGGLGINDWDIPITVVQWGINKIGRAHVWTPVT